MGNFSKYTWMCNYLHVEALDKTNMKLLLMLLTGILRSSHCQQSQKDTPAFLDISRLSDTFNPTNPRNNPTHEEHPGCLKQP